MELTKIAKTAAWATALISPAVITCLDTVAASVCVVAHPILFAAGFLAGIVALSGTTRQISKLAPGQVRAYTTPLLLLVGPGTSLLMTVHQATAFIFSHNPFLMGARLGFVSIPAISSMVAICSAAAAQVVHRLGAE